MSRESLVRRAISASFVSWVIVAAVMASATPAAAAAADDSYDGSDLWLRYEPVSDSQRRHEYRRLVTTIVVENASRNKVHRHTEDLQMEPGSREQLGGEQPGSGAERAGQGRSRAAGPARCRWTTSRATSCPTAR